MVAYPAARFMLPVADLAWLLVLASLCTILLYIANPGTTGCFGIYSKPYV